MSMTTLAPLPAGSITTPIETGSDTAPKIAGQPLAIAKDGKQVTIGEPGPSRTVLHHGPSGESAPAQIPVVALGTVGKSLEQVITDTRDNFPKGYSPAGDKPVPRRNWHTGSASTRWSPARRRRANSITCAPCRPRAGAC